MRPVPWTYVNSWRCIACGICCKEYDVALRFNEWLNIVKTYGVEVTVPGLNKMFLKRRSDGSCVFLRKVGNLWICSLQNSLKPQACKLWPFKIYTYPRYGQERQAIFKYNGKKFYIYIDPNCIGIRWGKPSQGFIEKTIPEFIKIALGYNQIQRYSTANVSSLIIQQLTKPKTIPFQIVRLTVNAVGRSIHRRYT